jgi:SAM-dependent methyltransferase
MTASQPVNHYQDRYWNDVPAVLSYLCRRATGDAGLWWMDYFKKRYATPPFQRALVFGCGTGWVERDLFDRGVATHFDAFDASPQYLESAESQRKDRSIRYFQSDFSSFRPEQQYDLLVNVAALHHVRDLYRVSATLASALLPTGLFVNWDYVGPSRNQYTHHHVAHMEAMNASLPERFRTRHPLRHPLSSFLKGDPTEAVHSADIPDAVDSYFETVECRSLGGGIAYQLLWNNIEEFLKDDAEAREVLGRILEADARLTATGEVPNLFSFFVCRPRPQPKSRLSHLFMTRVKEPLREQVADMTGGVYPQELVAQLLDQALRWSIKR